MKQEILAKIKECIKHLEPKAITYLYGSQARGDAGPDSDVDLLILLPDSYEGKEFVRKKFEISDHLYDLSMQLGVDLSPLVLVPKVFYARKTPFTVNVVNERILL